MTCPNRDGTLGVRGCIFCSAGGSGDFAGDRRTSITEQIEAVFEDALRKLRKIGITVIVHTILCLPGESREMMLDTIRYLNTQDIQGIKLQLLHILKHTYIDDYYEYLPFHLPSR